MKCDCRWRRLVEAERAEIGLEIERRWLDGAVFGAAGGPGRKLLPLVGAGFEGGDGATDLRRVVLQVVGEEGREDVLAEVEAGVLAEVERAEGAGVFDLLTVVPRAHHEEDLVVRRVLGLDGLVDGDGAVDVFLVPERLRRAGWGR